MKATIYCESSSKGIHSFYLVTSVNEYYMFSQNYRKGVHEYFNKGVRIDEATDFSKSRRDNAIRRTMTKIPVYIKYIEKEYGVEVLEQTKRKHRRSFCRLEAICA